MRKNIESLQTLRALCFISIFLSHAKIQPFACHGEWGVSVFLVLSGFVMLYSYWEKKNTFIKNYMFGFKKISKLYPLHILTTFLAVPLSLNYVLTQTSSAIKRIILDLCLVQSWFPNAEIYFSFNGVSWYLSTSVFLYFCFPYILARLKAGPSIKQTIKHMIAAYFFQIFTGYLSTLLPMEDSILYEVVRWYVYICPISRLVEFYIGCCLGYIYIIESEEIDNKDFNNFSIIEFIIFLIVLLQITTSYLKVYFLEASDPLAYSKNWWASAVIFTPTSAALVLLFAIKKGYISKLLTNDFSVKLGNISGYAFLVHQLVIRYIMKLCSVLSIENEAFRLFLVTSVSFGLTVAISVLWKYCTENRLNGL